MDIEPVWFSYATYDEDGFVNGIRDDAPESIKKAYAEYVKERQEYENSREPMPK